MLRPKMSNPVSPYLSEICIELLLIQLNNIRADAFRKMRSKNKMLHEKHTPQLCPWSFTSDYYYYEL